MKNTMSSILLLLLLLVSLSMHVSNGRHLSPRFKDSSIASHTSSKGAKTEETPLKAMEDIMVGKTVLKRMKSLATPMRNTEEMKKTAPPGSDQFLIASSHAVMPQSKGMEKRELPTAGIESNEEMVESRGGVHILADLGDMDYVGPHRGPSIHNR